MLLLIEGACMKSQYFLLTAALVVSSALAFGGELPDNRLTPGATNPEITQDNIQSTVCVKGFTKTIRPPAYYTNKLKKKQMRVYGYADRNPKHYEEDHLIPLSIGGNPTDPLNLWPEPRKSEWNANRKDQLEFFLYKKVCDGEIPLAEAQKEIAQDWIAAYKKYQLRPGKKHKKVD
jgi:hypothetical protein